MSLLDTGIPYQGSVETILSSYFKLFVNLSNLMKMVEYRIHQSFFPEWSTDIPKIQKFRFP